MTIPEKIMEFRDLLQSVDRLVLCAPGREEAVRELLHYGSFNGRLAVEPSGLVEGQELYVISRLVLADGEG